MATIDTFNKMHTFIITGNKYDGNKLKLSKAYFDSFRQERLARLMQTQKTIPGYTVRPRALDIHFMNITFETAYLIF